VLLNFTAYMSFKGHCQMGPQQGQLNPISYVAGVLQVCLYCSAAHLKGPQQYGSRLSYQQE